MALVDADGSQILQASPALEALVLAPLQGVSLQRSFPDADDLLALVDQAAQGTACVDVVDLTCFGVGTGIDGHVHDFDWEWSASPVPSFNGDDCLVLLTASDVTGHLENVERIEMLEGLVYLSRRVSAAEREEELYGPLADDIGRMFGARACLIGRLDTVPSRDPHMRVVRPMLPAYGVDSDVLRDVTIEITEGSAAWRVVAEGETFATNDLDADPELESYREIFHVLGARNAAIVPMRARKRTLAIMLILDKPDGWTGRDLDLAEVFAAEATLAVENTRLFEQEHRVASTLQEALLPGPTPQVPGLDLAAIYRPAGAAGSVGGDFYDVFAVPGGRFALMLGDVSGKGPEAAAQTALVRHMARGLALNERFPGPVVAELNSAVGAQGATEGFITLLYGIYDAEGSVLTFANAGHLRPLFWRRGERAREIGAPGRALGITAESDVRIDRVKLAPGDIVVWYTDGLSEARVDAGPFLGVAPLLRTIESVTDREAPEIAESLYDRALAHIADGDTSLPRLSDDVAILVIRSS